MVQSHYHEQALRTFRAITSGMSLKQLNRKTQWLKPLEQNAVISDLAN